MATRFALALAAFGLAALTVAPSTALPGGLPHGRERISAGCRCKRNTVERHPHTSSVAIPGRFEVVEARGIESPRKQGGVVEPHTRAIRVVNRRELRRNRVDEQPVEALPGSEEVGEEAG